MRIRRVLVFVDESNVVSSVRALGRKLDWLMLRDHLANAAGDADFVHLALQLRRRGIRVEVAATAQTLGTGLKGAANEVIDLIPLFEKFEPA